MKVVSVIRVYISASEDYGPFKHELVRLENGCTAYVRPGTKSLDEPEWWKGEVMKR